MTTRIIIIWIALALSALCHAQAPWDIKDPGTLQQQRCSECLNTLAAKPKEVQFGLYAEENGDVYLVVTEHRFFQQLFPKAGDGVAVDVIDPDRYTCGKEIPEQTAFYKGLLLKPTYRFELEKNKRMAPTGEVMVPVGKLPPNLVGRQVELNLVILKDHYVCYYNSFYDLAAYRWELLNMGLYMDTLTFRSSEDTLAVNDLGRSILRNKALHFTIPFSKGRSEYSAADLQPMYDSLRLTDFDIKRIDIQAYSSVEGPEEKNIELQEKRAASIVSALQSFQKPTIVTTVNASENWVEFIGDVSTTPYAYLATLPKESVKDKLRDRTIADALEPMLAQHRKAVVTLGLEKKRIMGGINAEQLVQDFERAITEKNLERAVQIQNEVFSRILDHQLPESFLDGLEVPKKKEFASLLNGRSAFRHFYDASDVAGTYKALKELERLSPTDGHIKYNLCALGFELWMIGDQVVVPAQLERDINALRNHGIEEPLVKRMLINFNILMAETYMMQGAYAKKDECMKYIFRNYRSLPLDDTDLLSLAQYFSSFANYDKAEQVLEKRINDIAVDRDLLFYYLNLTIIDEPTTQKPEYRKVMLNAISLDRPRFCSLFKPFGYGGVTFQLLDNSYLRSTWCENCQGIYAK